MKHIKSPRMQYLDMLLNRATLTWARQHRS